MDQAEQQAQRRRMVTKTSSVIRRKPLANITNIASSFSQSNKPGSSAASDSSIGSTQNPIIIHRPIIGSDNSVGDENRIEHARRQVTQNTRSKSKAAVPFYQTSIQETRNNGKERNVPAGSSTLEKVNDQGKVNQCCLGKTKNDGTKIYVEPPRYPSMETIKNKRKAIDVPSSAHHMKNANSNTDTHITRSAVKIIKDKGKESDGRSSSGKSDSIMTRKDKGKAIAQPPDHPSYKNVKSNMGIVPDSVMMRMYKGKAIADPLDYTSLKHIKSNTAEVRVPLKGVVIKERGESAEKIKDKGKENAVRSSYQLTGNANTDMGVTMADSLMKRKDKGKAIAEPLDYPSKKNLYRNMADFRVPLKGVIIKERGETVSGSSRVDIAQKDKGKAAVTPNNNRTLEKKDKLRSCPPPLRSTVNRNAADGSEGIIQYKPQTEPPPNKKKKRCSLNEEYTLPQDYVEQQRAYFKEIDDFELEVEEV